MKSLVVTANHEYAYMLGSATRKQHSAALLTGLGWTVFADIRRYQKLLFPGNAVREMRVSRPQSYRNAVFTPPPPFRRRRALIVSEWAPANTSLAIMIAFGKSSRQWDCP